MFLELRESHRLCPFQALVHLRAGALGSCELEGSGQRGMERIKGHTEGPWPAELGRRCWSSWQPASPSSLFVGREAAFQEAGSSAPPPRVLGILYMEVREEGRCQQEQSSVQAKFEEQSGLWTALWVFREETTLRVSCILTAS